jgi:hypothetical protein
MASALDRMPPARCPAHTHALSAPAERSTLAGRAGFGDRHPCPLNALRGHGSRSQAKQRMQDHLSRLVGLAAFEAERVYRAGRPADLEVEGVARAGCSPIAGGKRRCQGRLLAAGARPADRGASYLSGVVQAPVPLPVVWGGPSPSEPAAARRGRGSRGAPGGACPSGPAAAPPMPTWRL